MGNYIKLESVGMSLKFISEILEKSYLVIICANSCEKLTSVKFMKL